MRIKYLLCLLASVTVLGSCFGGGEGGGGSENSSAIQSQVFLGLQPTGYSIVSGIQDFSHYADRSKDRSAIPTPILRNDIVQLQQDEITAESLIKFYVEIPQRQIGFLIATGLHAIFSKSNLDGSKSVVIELDGHDFKEEVRIKDVQNVQGDLFPVGLYEVSFKRNAESLQSPVWFHIVENNSPPFPFIPPTSIPPPPTLPSPIPSVIIDVFPSPSPQCGGIPYMTTQVRLNDGTCDGGGYFLRDCAFMGILYKEYQDPRDGAWKRYFPGVTNVNPKPCPTPSSLPENPPDAG